MGRERSRSLRRPWGSAGEPLESRGGSLARLDHHFIWLLLALLVATAAIVTDGFLSFDNFINIAIASVALGLLVLGEGLVLMLAKLDLSIEVNMVFSALLGAVLILPPHTPAFAGDTSGGFGLPWPIALIAMLSVATLVGIINGLMVERLHMDPFMATLGMLLVLGGLSIAVGQGRQITNLPEGFRYLGSASLGKIPVAVLVMLVVYGVAHFILRWTVHGTRFYAVGSNRAAAVAAGISAGRVVIVAYALAGFLAGVAAFLLVGRLGTASAGISSGALFLAIAAAVVGGVSLFGGRGTATGMLGGLLLITTTKNALTLSNVSSHYVNVVAGGIILLAVLIDARHSWTREEV